MRTFQFLLSILMWMLLVTASIICTSHDDWRFGLTFAAMSLLVMSTAGK